MGDTVFVGKIVLVLGVFSSFLLLSTGTSIAGWDTFVTNVSRDPFANVPQWPSFGPPAVNITTGTLYMRNDTYAPFTDDILHSKILSLAPGSSTSTIVLGNGLNQRAYFVYPVSEISFQVGNWQRFLWLSASVPGDRISTTYENLDSQDPSWFSEQRCNQITTVTSPGEYLIQCTLASWTFASNRVLVLEIETFSGNAGTITVSYGNTTVESRIIPPTWTSSSTSNCSWNPITWAGCVVGTIDWTGSALLYLGGVVWILLNYVGFAIAWLIGIMVSFFGALISMSVYMLGGAGVPAPASYIFQVTFAAFLSMLLFMILSLLFGRSSPG